MIKDKLGERLLNHWAAFTIVVIVLLATIGIITAMSFVNVPAGHKGVVVSAPKNSFIGHTFDEGWHFNPYLVLCNIEIIRYNVQTVEFSVTYAGDEISPFGPVNVRSADNLEVYLDFAITYHIPPEQVSYLRINYGDYIHTVFQQIARSVPRDIASQYNALPMAGELRPLVEQSISDNITTSMFEGSEGCIVVDMFNLREVQLPDDVDAAVQRKKVAEQDLITAAYNANRTVVLAQGQAAALVINASAQANATVIRANGSAEAIQILMDMLKYEDPNATADSLLRYLYIQALTDPNTNISWIIIQSPDGVPIIIQPPGG